MFKRSVMVAFMIMMLITAGVAVQAGGDGQTVTVTANYLNVRQGPSTSATILLVVRAGQTYPVIGQSGTWWQIQVGDIKGYVSGRYVTVNGSGGTVNPTPVVNPNSDSNCTRTLFFRTTPEDICIGVVNKTQAAYQTYQNGFMIWLADSGDIWVFVNSGSRSPWTHLRQSDYAGFPDATGTPPSSLVLPINGFGRVWANVSGLNQSTLKNELGWATSSEISYSATWQNSFHATVGNIYLTVPDGRIVDAYTGMAGIFWSFVQ